eukprot:6491492-Amphidinium_carterae.2
MLVEAGFVRNFLNPYGETSTANLDVSVLRAVVAVGMNIEQWVEVCFGRHPTGIPLRFYTRRQTGIPSSSQNLCGLRIGTRVHSLEVKEGVVWSTGESEVVGEEKDAVIRHVTGAQEEQYKYYKRKSKVRVTEATTVRGDQVETEFDIQFDSPLGLLAVHADDLLCAANLDVLKELQVSVDNQWKTGPFQVLGEEGCDELVYLGTQIEYDPMHPDQSVILLHQERYTYELMDRITGRVQGSL